MARQGFEKASAFSLLEHEEEEGWERVDRPRDNSSQAAAAAAAAKPTGKPKPAVRQQGGQTVKDKQAARAEDYYRAFEHVYEDPTSKETVLRFHKTNIVRIRPSGDMMLTTGGWFTATTVAALNDALQALGMVITYQPPVSAGNWILTDDAGAKYQFKDSMVLRASLPEHKSRGTKLLRAYNGGLEVPRYVRKPGPGSGQQPATAAAARQQAGPGPTGQAAGRRPQQQQQHQQHQQHVNYQQAAAVAGAGPRPAAADIQEQLAAAMQDLGMDHDEFAAGDDHLCVVCLEHPRCEVLVPCGHMMLCHTCCLNVIDSTNECPMCREKIEDHCIIDPDV